MSYPLAEDSELHASSEPVGRPSPPTAQPRAQTRSRVVGILALLGTVGLVLLVVSGAIALVAPLFGWLPPDVRTALDLCWGIGVVLFAVCGAVTSVVKEVQKARRR